MFVARWQLMAPFGKVEDLVSLLRKWEIDVGERIGWKASSVRLLAGFLGGSQSGIELEVHADDLADLESALRDMEQNPHHREYVKQFERCVLSSCWVIYKDVGIAPDEA